MTPVAICWSGGKDSVLTLSALRADPAWEPVALLTTFTRDFDRVSMHGVRRELIHAQADSLGLPLREVFITAGANNVEYEAAMLAELRTLREQGVTTIAFGDLFLADIRAYRERLLGRLELTPLFPIWGRDTARLAREFIAQGFRATLCCVDSRALPTEFAGREFNTELLAALPAAVDPCGENGEFHSFVHDGPDFRQALDVTVGAERSDGPFVFRDLLPAASLRSPCDAAVADFSSRTAEAIA